MPINDTEYEQNEAASERGEIPNGQLLGFAAKLMGMQEQKVLHKAEGTDSIGGEDYKGNPKLTIRTQLQDGMSLTSSQNHSGETHTFRVKAEDGSEDVARIFVSPDRKATVFINDEPTSDPDEIAKFGALFDVPFSVAESKKPVFVEAAQDEEDTIEETRTEVVEDLFDDDEVIAKMEEQFEAPTPEMPAPDPVVEEAHHHEVEEQARQEVEAVLAQAPTEAAGEEIIEEAEEAALESSPEESVAVQEAPNVEQQTEEVPVVDPETNPAEVAKSIIEVAQQPVKHEQEIRPASKMEADFIKQVIAGEYLTNGNVRHILGKMLNENDKRNERKSGESAQRLIERASSDTIELSARARAALKYIQDQNLRANSSIWDERPSASAQGRIVDQLYKALQVLAHELGR